MARSDPPKFDGFVVVDKPAGMTSHDVVARCRRAYGQRQVGHGGTLDPDATGVLVVALGAATRLLRFVTDATKRYRATIVFGTATNTLDASGTVTATASMHIDRAQVEAATAGFVGTIEQVPPMVSAIKVDGRRLHELARAGVEVERKPRTVTVHSFDVETFQPATDSAGATATVVVACSSGTYVRSLAADVGEALDGVAHLRDLRRLAVGRFDIDQAHPLDDVMANGAAFVLPIGDALGELERVVVDDVTAHAVAHGATFRGADLLRHQATTDTTDAAIAGPLVVCDADGAVLAIYEPWRGDIMKPAVVLARPETRTA